jgi:hypothetical protein
MVPTATHHCWMAHRRNRSRAKHRPHGYPSRPQSPMVRRPVRQHRQRSRTALAQRFTRLLGQPPLTYIADRRLSRAAELLHTSAAPIPAIGQPGWATHPKPPSAGPSAAATVGPQDSGETPQKSTPRGTPFRETRSDRSRFPHPKQHRWRAVSGHEQPAR